MIDFVHLHGHSCYSLQDAVGQPKDIVIAALDKGMNSIALTEHGHMNSFAPFYLYCKKNNFKGIYGCEFYYVDSLKEWQELKNSKDVIENVPDGQVIENETESREEAKKVNPLRKYAHLLVLAQNKTGLYNLFKLINHSFIDGFYYRPRIDSEMLKRFNEGLICTSACCVGPLSRLITEYKESPDLQKEIVDKKIQEFINIFGKERFLLEVQWNKLDFQHDINKYIIDASKRFDLKLVSAVDYHYPKLENHIDRTILKNTTGFYAKNEIIENISREELDCELWIKNGNDIIDYVKTNKIDYISDDLLIESIKNTVELSNLIDNIELNTSPKLLKLYDNSFARLITYCQNELKNRNLDSKDYLERLLYELNILKELEKLKGLQYADYFFLMKEIIDLCRKEMLIGCGRGSSAGSLICFLMNITSVDPLKFGLSFDRFISVDRLELPDIDTDFSNPQRAREIVMERFGQENVAYITSYGTLQLKNCLKDVCRSYGIEFEETNKITRLVDFEVKPHIKIQDKSLFSLDWETAKKYSTSVQNLLKKYPQIDSPINNLMGTIRNVGTHAAGICIANDIGYQMPILLNKKRIQTSYTEGVSKKHLAEMGFIKFDILGLNTLNIIDTTLQIVANGSQEKYEELLNSIHSSKINFNDQEVYEKIYHDGNFTSVFQFESSGMRKLCKTIKPINIFELSDIISIYRPGPLEAGMDVLYFENRNNKENIQYDHPILKTILEKTYGTCLYQEQVMAICNKLALMTIADTNAVRKYFVKRSREALADHDALTQKGNELYSKFKDGALKNNVSIELINKLWEQFQGWTSYGFNLSHSISYAIISYQTAYLRTKYPEAFVLSILNNDFNEKILLELMQQGFDINNVDINNSDAKFTYDNKTKTFQIPFIIIKGIGDAALEQLTKLQKTNTITSFKQFLEIKQELKLSKINKRVVEGLIKAGAFNEIETNHAKMFKLIEYNNLKAKDKKDINEDNFCNVKDLPPSIKFDNEIEVLGISLNSIKNRKQKYEINLDYVSFDEFIPGQKNLMYLQIMSIKVNKTKHGNKYYILDCCDNNMKIEKIKCWNGDEKFLVNQWVYGYVEQDNWGFKIQSFVKI